jgi:hypothetical protein
LRALSKSLYTTAESAAAGEKVTGDPVLRGPGAQSRGDRISSVGLAGVEPHSRLDNGRGRAWLGVDFVRPAVCALFLIVAIAIANPFVNSAFNDDWSYSDTALQLAQTGRMHYNSWGSPTILFQSLWAALFIRAFGFGFNLIRVLTIPFSIASVWLTYLVARETGLRPAFAFFATLTTALSPLFFPLTASFMTEPYALCFVMLCLYAALRIEHSRTESEAMPYVWVLAIAGCLGGSDRQSVWLVPLLLIPYVAWRRREWRRFLAHSIVSYVVVLGLFGTVLLVFHPGYAVSKMSLGEWASVIRKEAVRAFHSWASVALVSALMCLPAFLCASALWTRLRLRQLVLLGLLCFFGFDYLRSAFGQSLGVAPFLGNLIGPHGILEHASGLGSRPQVWHKAEGYVITVFLIFAVGGWALTLNGAAFRERKNRPSMRIFSLYALPYFALLVPAAMLAIAFDRYGVMILPVLVTAVLVPIQDSIRRVSAAAWACLLMYAIYSVLGAHDYFRNLEARSRALLAAEKRGIPRLSIGSGVEQDGWTQLRVAGDVRPAMYPWAFGDSYNRFYFSYYTTAIKPDYVTYSCARDLVPPQAVVTVPYRTWLPPSWQAVAVLRKEDVPKP